MIKLSEYNYYMYGVDFQRILKKLKPEKAGKGNLQVKIQSMRDSSQASISLYNSLLQALSQYNDN
jgi:uncharacterized protein YbcI